jgi:hypothetical protein
MIDLRGILTNLFRNQLYNIFSIRFFRLRALDSHISFDKKRVYTLQIGDHLFLNLEIYNVFKLYRRLVRIPIQDFTISW